MLGLQKPKLRLTKPLLLVSRSSKKKELLEKIGIFPTLIKIPNIDEKVQVDESPRCYTARIAKLKISAFRDCSQYEDYIMLSANTVIVISGKIIAKPYNVEETKIFLYKISGRRHRVYTSICFVDPPNNIILRTVVSIVKVKRLSSKDIDFYLSINNWSDKSGEYVLQGFAEAFIQWFRGSYSAIIGLPLCQVYKVIDNYLLYEKS